MSRTEHILLAVAIFLFLGIFGLLLTLYNDSSHEHIEYRPPVAGIMLLGKTDDAGWNRQHYLGFRDAAQDAGIKVDIKEEITLDTQKGGEAIRELASHGCDLIIASSASFAADIHKARAAGLRTIFALPKLEEKSDGCIPYFLRLYQAEYLAGMVSGMRTRSGKLGYVAAMKNSEICRGVNAFTLGARSVNPNVEVIVTIVGAWDDPKREWAACEALRYAGVDILNSHQDGMTVQEYADTHKMEYISYLESYNPPGDRMPTGSLLTIECHWDVVFRTILRDYLRGSFQKVYWLGMDVNALDVVNFSPRITGEERKRILDSREQLKERFTVFSGEMHDNQGNLRCMEGESLSDASLMYMDWYVEGVKTYESSVVTP